MLRSAAIRVISRSSVCSSELASKELTMPLTLSYLGDADLADDSVCPFVLQGLLGPTGIDGLFRRNQINTCLVNYQSLFHLTKTNTAEPAMSSFARAFASQTSKRKDSSKREREISTVENPFDAPTYNIPQKPVTFTEGASYSLVILAGLGIAAAAAYGVFSELIFSPKEYKVFGMALKRVQNDSQVSVRIGSPVTGYGQDSRNRAARQRIPHRIWTDEDGVEHVEASFIELL
uniref:Mitochondrial import inner membrane translocase subunit Tim21 n=1 Tax=Daucus carota subsp. sativus TaxID=79200 RepID=A0A161ZNN1_DAUCS